jgi:hypothetical protein
MLCSEGRRKIELLVAKWRIVALEEIDIAFSMASVISVFVYFMMANQKITRQF